MKTLTQNDIKNHKGISIGDEVHLNDLNGTIVKVVNVQFVFKFGRTDTYIDYQWRTERYPMFQTQNGISLENFRKLLLDI